MANIYKVEGFGKVRVVQEVVANSEKEAREKADKEFQGIRSYEMREGVDSRVRQQLVGVSGDCRIFPDGEWVEWDGIEMTYDGSPK